MYSALISQAFEDVPKVMFRRHLVVEYVNFWKHVEACQHAQGECPHVGQPLR